MKNDIEDERRLLDRTVEKLQREVSALESAAQEHSSQQMLISFFLFLNKELSFSYLLVSYLNNAEHFLGFIDIKSRECC